MFKASRKLIGISTSDRGTREAGGRIDTSGKGNLTFVGVTNGPGTAFLIIENLHETNGD
jgi:hypothetical protein